MPNGFYPVPGLDVLFIHRTEQGYPRIDWTQAWSTFRAVEFTGPRGYTPLGNLQLQTHSPTFEDLVESARKVIAEDTELQGAGGSVVLVDFKKREGWAVGSFCAYGIKDGAVSIVHDLTLGSVIPPGGDYEQYKAVVECLRTNIDGSGITVYGSETPPSYRFSFAGMQEFVISNTALHYSEHWPPRNVLDFAMLALCRSERRDIILALWKEGET